MAERGHLLIFSGPSGAGKTTVLRRVLEESKLPLKMSVSATTRPPRPGEIDGVGPACGEITLRSYFEALHAGKPDVD